jgi:hypothetical protein
MVAAGATGITDENRLVSQPKRCSSNLRNKHKYALRNFETNGEEVAVEALLRPAQERDPARPTRLFQVDRSMDPTYNFSVTAYCNSGATITDLTTLSFIQNLTGTQLV